MIHNILKNAEDAPRTSKNPSLYYKAVEIVKSVQPEQRSKLHDIIEHIERERDSVSKIASELSTVAQLFHEETVRNVKTNRSVMSVGGDEDDAKYNFKDHNFIILLASTVSALRSTYSELHRFVGGLVPPSLITAKKKIDAEDLEDFDQMNSLFNEMNFNGHALDAYLNSLITVFNLVEAPKSLASELYKEMEKFYKYLLQVHTRDGMRIIKNPVVTNVAMHIFENIDSHGEVQRDNKQVSAYTMRKAETLTGALTNPTVQEFVSDPDKMQYLVRVAVVDVANIVRQLIDLFQPQKSDISMVSMLRPSWLDDDTMPRQQLSMIDSIKFSSVVYHQRVDESGDQLAAKMRDETITKIAEMLTEKDVDFNKIVEYVIDRKAELNKFFFEENSFYVCKIGEGNPFMGQAPGALYVEPAERPRGALEDILGSGFEEIRDFHSSIEHASKFHDLFVATSPSKSADKSNVLMVGPMGCGKTEVLRAVGADRGSIGVFAQGSDFLTCWKGEAEKNPKRLFQEGLRLSQESGRHVHFLIDEIDSLLNNDRDLSGNNNLTLEFQILMDGVVRYPNLSVWGATNHVHRIPMPMIRRFNKVLVVGELDRSDRADLLKRFTSYMPITSKVTDRDWENWAVKLEGATGDVMRKIADHIWRSKMTTFVSERPDRAEEMVKLLNDGGRFSVDRFGKDDREKFKRELSKYVMVTASDMDQSISDALVNVGIRSEIQTAVATYKSAKEYLMAAKEGIAAKACELENS